MMPLVRQLYHVPLAFTYQLLQLCPLIGERNSYLCYCINKVTFKLFRAHSGYIRHETFSFMMSLPAMSLGWVLREQKGRDRGRCMAASGLVLRSDLVGTGRAISVLFGINGVRNK